MLGYYALVNALNKLIPQNEVRARAHTHTHTHTQVDRAYERMLTYADRWTRRMTGGMRSGHPLESHVF